MIYCIYFLGLNNDRLIIYGGQSSTFSAVNPDLAVLDMSSKPYQWIVPQVSGDPPTSVMMHTARVIGKYMIIAYGIKFGILINFFFNTYSSLSIINRFVGYAILQKFANSDIYLLDISDDSEYKWITSIDPKLLSAPDSPLSNNTSLSNTSPTSGISIGILIGSVIGASLGTCLLMIFAFITYRYCKKRSHKYIPTPGDLTSRK